MNDIFLSSHIIMHLMIDIRMLELQNGKDETTHFTHTFGTMKLHKHMKKVVNVI
jgi:hypothetical protein